MKPAGFRNQSLFYPRISPFAEKVSVELTVPFENTRFPDERDEPLFASSPFGGRCRLRSYKALTSSLSLRLSAVTNRLDLPFAEEAGTAPAVAFDHARLANGYDYLIIRLSSNWWGVMVSHHPSPKASALQADPLLLRYNSPNKIDWSATAIRHEEL